MKSNLKILFSALCLWTLVSACISEASVTIKSKNLDDIDDIVSLATDSEKAEMKKYSLGVMTLENSEAGPGKYVYVNQISIDRSASDTQKKRPLWIRY